MRLPCVVFMRRTEVASTPARLDPLDHAIPPLVFFKGSSSASAWRHDLTRGAPKANLVAVYGPPNHLATTTMANQLLRPDRPHAAQIAAYAQRTATSA